MLPIIRRPRRRTKGRFACAKSISSAPSRTSLVESMRSNRPLLGSMATWTFGVGTTWILHYCSDGRPSSPENHSKSFVTNDFQPSHSHLMAEAPEIGGGWGGWGPRRPSKGNQLALSKLDFDTPITKSPEQQSGELSFSTIRDTLKIVREFIENKVI